jgi:hypothetical protein
MNALEFSSVSKTLHRICESVQEGINCFENANLHFGV